MKKILLITIILFLTGCQNNYDLNINNIQSIKFNDIYLLEQDFKVIEEEINKLNFVENKIDNSDSKDLDIVSNDKIYNFKISNNSIYYKENNKYYISKSSDNLNSILESIKNKYTDLSFLKVEYGECTSSKDDLSIKINTSNSCLIINSDKDIFNFKIHSLNSNNNFSEEELLYQKNKIENNKIIIKYLLLNTTEIKISFDTEYNYNISMLPTYENNELKTNIEFSQKK